MEFVYFWVIAFLLGLCCVFVVGFVPWLFTRRYSKKGLSPEAISLAVNYFRIEKGLTHEDFVAKYHLRNTEMDLLRNGLDVPSPSTWRRLCWICGTQMVRDARQFQLKESSSDNKRELKCLSPYAIGLAFRVSRGLQLLLLSSVVDGLKIRGLHLSLEFLKAVERGEEMPSPLLFEELCSFFPDFRTSANLMQDAYDKEL